MITILIWIFIIGCVCFLIIGLFAAIIGMAAKGAADFVFGDKGETDGEEFVMIPKSKLKELERNQK